MPINIIDYSNTKRGEKGKPLEVLCDDEWEMPIQIEELEKWLIQNQNNLSKGSYVADIGFSPRKEALGGGGCPNPTSHENHAFNWYRVTFIRIS